MKIIAINTPSILHNGVKYETITKMFGSFKGFERYLMDMEDEVDICYFHSVTNTDSKNELVLSMSDQKPVLFFRFRLIPKTNANDK